MRLPAWLHRHAGRDAPSSRVLRLNEPAIAKEKSPFKGNSVATTKYNLVCVRAASFNCLASIHSHTAHRRPSCQRLSSSSTGACVCLCCSTCALRQQLTSCTAPQTSGQHLLHPGGGHQHHVHQSRQVSVLLACTHACTPLLSVSLRAVP